MSSIVVAGDTSGSVTLQAPAVAGTTTLTLPTTSGTVDAFPSGTKLLFQQTAAPTGWTKDVSHNDKALRVVSGTASSGGSVAFTTAFASQTPAGTVGNTTLVESQIPAHRHVVRGDTRADTVGVLYGGNGGTTTNMTPASSGSNQATYTGQLYGWDTGGSGAHNHSFTGSAIDLAVQYIDVIVCTKN